MKHRITGRRCINYGNDAFIGNVGWRRNGQNHDAIPLFNKSIEGLAPQYDHLNRVNRILGSEADAQLSLPTTNAQDIAACANLFNTFHNGIKGLTPGGYAFIMNFEDVGSWDNNTFAINAKKDAFEVTPCGELALQHKADPERRMRSTRKEPRPPTSLG